MLVQKGNWSTFTVPLEHNQYGELDMVDEENGTLYIAEAKNKGDADYSQLNDSFRLTLRLRRAVVFVLPQKVSQEEALNAAYRAIPEAQSLPFSVVIQISYTAYLPDRGFHSTVGIIPHARRSHGLANRGG